MADAAPVAVVHDLRYYLRPIRRHLGLVAGCVVLGLVLSVALAVSIRPVYTANAKVQDTANVVDLSANPTGSRNGTPVNMDNETQALKSSPVAAGAKAILKTSTSIGKLESKVVVTVAPNSTTMKIACTAHSPKAAAACANAFASAYLNNRLAVAQAFVANQVAHINNELATTRQTLSQDAKAVSSSPPRSQAHRTERSKEVQDKTQISNLSVQLSNDQAGATYPGRLLSGAVTGGTSPNQLRETIVLAGLVLGALLGLIAAPLREHLGRRVSTEDDLTRAGVDLIAEVPRRRRGRRGRTAAARKADSVARARAEQRLAAVIGAALGQEGGSVYLAELSGTVGRQGFADRLAAELGRFGSTTEIITLGATPRPAVDPRTLDPLSHVRAIDTSATQPHETTAPVELGWPTPGQDPAPSRELVPAKATGTEVVISGVPAPPMDEVAGVLGEVQAALARSRYVIVHGPNGTVGSEAYILASLSVVTALVVEADVTTRVDLADVIDQVEVTSSELLGAMLWRPAPADKSSKGRRPAKPASPLAARTPKEPKESKAAKEPKAPREPQAPKEVPARRDRPARVKPSKVTAPKPPRLAKAEKTKAETTKPEKSKQPRAPRRLRKLSPPVDGYEPGTPTSGLFTTDHVDPAAAAPVPDLFASNDDADPGDRARPFDSTR
jgi:capsular polysaccharide biosynthesis protein